MALKAHISSRSLRSPSWSDWHVYSLFLGWAGRTWGRDPFSTSDLWSGTLFLSLSGIFLHSLSLSQSKLTIHPSSSSLLHWYWFSVVFFLPILQTHQSHHLCVCVWVCVSVSVRERESVCVCVSVGGLCKSQYIKGSKERLFIGTQSANFWGNPLCRATKQHLSNN